MSEQNHEGDRWARLRFAIVGPLLAATPAHGELREALAQLARKPWRHPTSGAPVCFARSTIERWYYLAQQAKADPVSALRPKRRQDAGHTRRLSPALQLALQAQYQAHPSWSYRLHHDNLVVLLVDDPTLGARPAYATVRRYLKCLNEATQAWVELEYQRAHHSELGCSPLQRYLQGPAVGRESPSSDALRRAFRAAVSRRQRRSDGTFSLEGRRYEVPSRYRHLERLHLRYARWDLASVDLVDPHQHTILCALYPLDKSANADGQRRRLDPMTEPPSAPQAPPPASGMAPLLRQLMAQYAATGLPPAYLPKVTTTPSPDTDSELAK